MLPLQVISTISHMIKLSHARWTALADDVHTVAMPQAQGTFLLDFPVPLHTDFRGPWLARAAQLYLQAYQGSARDAPAQTCWASYYYMWSTDSNFLRN